MLKRNWFIIVGSIVMLIVITLVIAEMTNSLKKCGSPCPQSKTCLSQTANLDCDTTASCKNNVCQSDCQKTDCYEDDSTKTCCESVTTTHCEEFKCSNDKQVTE